MRRILAVVVVCLLGVACGDGDGGDEDAAGTTAPTSVDAASLEALGPIADEAASPGRLRLELGTSLSADLEVTDCAIALDAQPDGEVPATLVGVTASGTADGRAVNVDLRRFRSAGASDTITDTITVAIGDPDAPEQALVAQRFEVDGLVSDPRDPDADDPLIRVRSGEVTARGVFAPPGAFAADGGLVEGLVRAACA